MSHGIHQLLAFNNSSEFLAFFHHILSFHKFLLVYSFAILLASNQGVAPLLVCLKFWTWTFEKRSYRTIPEPPRTCFIQHETLHGLLPDIRCIWIATVPTGNSRACFDHLCVRIIVSVFAILARLWSVQMIPILSSSLWFCFTFRTDLAVFSHWHSYFLFLILPRKIIKSNFKLFQIFQKPYFLSVAI